MPDPRSHDVTELLLAWRSGDEAALADLMPIVYRRLKEIAGRLVRSERQENSLEATALVHEAYLRLIDIESISWKDRAHFFAMAARIMRRVLVDHARHRTRQKRGGTAPQAIEISELRQLPGGRAPQLLALDEALSELAKHDEQMAQIVEMRFFGGLDREQISEVMAVSSATVTRRWRTARAWLGSYLNAGGGPESVPSEAS